MAQFLPSGSMRAPSSQDPLPVHVVSREGSSLPYGRNRTSAKQRLLFSSPTWVTEAQGTPCWSWYRELRAQGSPLANLNSSSRCPGAHDRPSSSLHLLTTSVGRSCFPSVTARPVSANAVYCKGTQEYFPHLRRGPEVLYPPAPN